ncbi:MAG: hypothetical protein RLZZ196_1127 [Bacteroidota bacterium]
MLVVVGLNYFNIIKVKNKNMNLSIKELNELIYSLGITASKGMMCDKELNVSLLDKLQCELNYRIGLEAIDEEIEVSSHYVSNEEADEDYRSTLEQDSNRYETSVIDDYRIHLRKLKTPGYASQAILDYVDKKGAATYSEMQSYYRSITGSNSFSHILANLRIPYKNRKTQRYLAKEGKDYSNAKYVVKLANPSNWVVKDYDYKTFNEAPYGDN